MKSIGERIEPHGTPFLMVYVFDMSLPACSLKLRFVISSCTNRTMCLLDIIFDSKGWAALSESGVGRLLSNQSLPEQTLRGKNKQNQHRHEDMPKAATHDNVLSIKALSGNGWKVFECRK